MNAIEEQMMRKLLYDFLLSSMAIINEEKNGEGRRCRNQRTKSAKEKL